MRRMWFSRRAIVLHAVILIVVPAFFALCDWQVHRALAGNELSWAYVFEWPFFAGYAVYMWWRFVHEDAPQGSEPIDESSTTQLPGGTAAPAPTLAEDANEAERSAYNQYLAELAAQDKRKQWR